jgi:hypothetical protein
MNKLTNGNTNYILKGVIDNKDYNRLDKPACIRFYGEAYINTLWDTMRIEQPHTHRISQRKKQMI